MADLLPPIVVELLSKSDAFRQGLVDAKGEMAGFATEMEGHTSAVGDAEAGMAAKGKKAAQDLEGAHSDLESKTSGFAGRMQSMFTNLGSTMGAWGLPFGESVSKMGEKVGDAETKGKGLSQSLVEAGKVATVATAAGLAAAGAESIHLAENFEQATAGVAASAGISTQAAESIGKAFLSTRGETTFSAQEMMSAYQGVAGQLKATEGHALGAHQSLQFMTAAMDLAEGSGQSLSSTTTGLAAVMQAYGLNTSQAASAADTLFSVSQMTNTPISTLSTIVDRLKGRLGSLAPTLQDVGTLMAFPAIASQGSRGAMIVNTALQTLLGGSKATNSELSSLGVNLYDAHGKFVGMRDVIAQLGPKLAGMNDQQRQAAEKTLFGASAAQLMDQVMTSGVGSYDKTAKAVSKVGAAHDAAEKQAKTFHGTMEKLKSTGEDLGVSFGQFLIPKLEDLAKYTADVVNWFEQHKAAAIALATVIGGALTLAVGAFAVNTMANMVKSIGSAVDNLGKLGDKAGSVAQTVLQKFGLMKQSTDDLKTSTDELGTSETNAGNDASGATGKVAGLGQAESTENGEASGAAGSEGALATSEQAAGSDASAATGEVATLGGAEATEGAEASTAAGEEDALAASENAAGGGGLLGGAGAGAAAGAAGVVGPLAAGYGVLRASGQGEQQTLDSMTGDQKAAYLSFVASGKNIQPSTFMKDYWPALSGTSGGPAHSTAPGSEIMIPARASGGPVNMGMPYMVGEEGPELFVPSSAGYIAPNGALAGTLSSGDGGGRQIVINVTVQSGADPNEIAREIGWEMRQYAGVGL